MKIVKYIARILFIITLTTLPLLTPKPTLALEECAPDAPLTLDKYMCAKGSFLDNVAKGLTVRIDGDKDAQIQGLIPMTANYIALMYSSPPATTQNYIAHLYENIGLPMPKKVQAQGIGYKMFEPVMKLWQIFKNLAYTIYILIFLVIGFMIMFRTKINAQTVITIESAIPNLIITLLLITFSYAIAGFLVDIMYFLIYFIIYLASSNGLINAQAVTNYFMQHSALGILLPIGKEDIVINEISRATANLIGGILGAYHDEEGINWILKFIISVMLGMQMIKLLIGLLKSYLLFIVQIVTAPLQILPNAIPGSKAFSSWLRKSASYLAPFPILTAIFLFSLILVGPPSERIGKPVNDNPFGTTNTIFSDQSAQRIAVFPYISSVGVTGKDISILLAFVIILVSPASIKMAQEMFKVKESPYISEVIEGIKNPVMPYQMAKGWINQKRENKYRNSVIELARNRSQKIQTGPKAK